MSVKKTYVKSRNICRARFQVPEKQADEICLVGDFNSWDTTATPMRKNRNGFSATLDLEPGREYQFRYLIDGERWENDDGADAIVPSPFPDAENSVIQA